MAESTASSVTKNRIKTNYHGALEGLLQGVSPATFDINAITAPSSINNNNNNQRSV